MSADFFFDLMATLGVLVTVVSGVALSFLVGAWTCDEIERFQRMCYTASENNRVFGVLSDRVRALEKQLSELKKAQPKRGAK